jgi:hypothetical protein
MILIIYSGLLAFICGAIAGIVAAALFRSSIASYLFAALGAALLAVLTNVLLLYIMATFNPDAPVNMRAIVKAAGLSFWLAILISLLMVGTAKRRRRSTKGHVPAPSAPRRPNPLRDTSTSHALIAAYGEVLANQKSPFAHFRGKTQTPEEVLATDPFTLSGGRSADELPASKERIRFALAQAMQELGPGPLQQQLRVAYVELANFQDIRWCKKNGVDPGSKMLAEGEKLLKDLSSIESSTL